MSLFSVDIEADGPEPIDYNMVQIGVVLIDKGEKLDKTFYGELKPKSGSNYSTDALKSFGVTRNETLSYPHPEICMADLSKWLYKNNEDGRIMMLSDNAGFDWMFVCAYFHHFTSSNPFGFSCTSLTSLYKGFMKNKKANFKRLRKTKHTHNPVDDAMGNAEAYLEIMKQGYKG